MESIVIGGDGRYYNPEAIQTVIQIALANQVKQIYVGQRGFFSTPAMSCFIRKYQLDGGFILTASHNPGGPNHDFGIKFNSRNGGPAPESITNRIFEETNKIEYFNAIDSF